MRFTVSKKLNAFLVTLLLMGIGGAIFLATQMFTIDLVGQLRKGIWDVSSLLAGRVRGEMVHSAKWAQVLGAASIEDFRYSQDRVKFTTGVAKEFCSACRHSTRLQVGIEDL